MMAIFSHTQPCEQKGSLALVHQPSKLAKPLYDNSTKKIYSITHYRINWHGITYRFVGHHQTEYLTSNWAFALVARQFHPVCGSVLASLQTSDSAQWGFAEAHAGCQTQTTLQTQHPCPSWQLLGAPCGICSTSANMSLLHNINTHFTNPFSL